MNVWLRPLIVASVTHTIEKSIYTANYNHSFNILLPKLNIVIPLLNMHFRWYCFIFIRLIIIAKLNPQLFLAAVEHIHQKKYMHKKWMYNFLCVEKIHKKFPLGIENGCNWEVKWRCIWFTGAEKWPFGHNYGLISLSIVDPAHNRSSKIPDNEYK